MTRFYPSVFEDTPRVVESPAARPLPSQTSFDDAVLKVDEFCSYGEQDALQPPVSCVQLARQAFDCA